MENISFNLNGNDVSIKTESSRILLWILRIDFGLTGTKYGCGEGHCGACTVLVNNEAVRSCQLTVKDVAGKEVVTIEGLSKNGKLHPLQKAFIEHNAFQCGFCTSGMILNAYGFLMKNPKPSRTEIIEGMNDNLCRCGAHIRIIRAIESVALQPNKDKE
ncbi:MAG: (2Fe-2S)-binding protein [Candidatus Schekmanbacteria bacterium]|nr:MAG: (2Fe-2S)-binding protein [Candidatus Schekmanbacteria bacterium]